MANWYDGAMQKTRNFFENTNVVLVKANSPKRFGIANKLSNGEITITNRRDMNRVWTYEDIESMLADGWVVD